jgi:hypothetical protein
MYYPSQEFYQSIISVYKKQQSYTGLIHVFTILWNCSVIGILCNLLNVFTMQALHFDS